MHIGIFEVKFLKMISADNVVSCVGVLLTSSDQRGEIELKPRGALVIEFSRVGFVEEPGQESKMGP